MRLLPCITILKLLHWIKHNHYYYGLKLSSMFKIWITFLPRFWSVWQIYWLDIFQQVPNAEVESIFPFPPLVNFSNILWAVYAPIPFLPKIYIQSNFCTKFVAVVDRKFGPQNGGNCRQVVAIRRWSLAQVWLYTNSKNRKAAHYTFVWKSCSENADAIDTLCHMTDKFPSTYMLSKQ